MIIGIGCEDNGVLVKQDFKDSTEKLECEVSDYGC